jgi:sugar phosphate isomerase/epimerase
MIHSGLVSVTFRQLSAGEIVELVAQAGLEGIEWGGDVHVPHGDVACAREVYQRTVDAGLAVCSYGSYYRVGHDDSPPFEDVVDTALALHAPLVRVWAGRRGSAEADAAYWQRVVQDSLRIADLAEQAGLAQPAGLGVAYEYHGNTLTDTNASALRLLREGDHAALSTYWQCRGEGDEEEHLAGLRAVLPRLSYVHVNTGRRPLAEGQDLWLRRLDIVRSTGRDHWALIEFVQDDAPEALLCDAATLRAWLAG